MARKNAEYWKTRFEILEKSQHNRGMECYAELESQYRKAEKEIEGQISAWYQRFADNNEISLTEARRMLNSKELAEFKWDVNDYIKYGEENAINGQWTKQLENASARYHVSRLESLEVQMQQQVEVLFGNQLDTIDTAMKDIYTDGYYHTAFEIQKGVGVGWDFSTLDTKAIDKVINKPWAADGKNFSERIWDNREKLVNELNQTLVQNIILGQDPQKAIDAIADKLNVSKRNAGRLVMTEEAYFSSEAQKDCFKELDVEQYEIVATLDSHTSEICQAMDGKVFPMSQWETGATAPPFHPWCRTTTVPAFGDEFDDIGTRAARDEETGKTYQVPGNCTYGKWEKAFVEGDKSVLQEKEKSGKIQMGNLSEILGKEHADAMQKILEEAPENVQNLWNKYVDRLGVTTIHSTDGAYYSTYEKGISIDIDKCAKGDKYPQKIGDEYEWVQSKSPYYTVFHEFGHNISSLMAQDAGERYGDMAEIFKSKIFTKTVAGQNGLVEIGYNLTEMVNKEGKAYFNSVYSGLKAEAKANGLKANSVRKIDAWSKIADEIRSKPVSTCTDVSDLFDGVSNGSCLATYGHTCQNKNYWNSIPVGDEAFAEMFSATVMNPGSVNEIKNYFPDSYEIFLEMIGG